ncbi:Hypothetical protein A7982_03883 [Minicystis rosea]|nr:Hypothetical protein A7982_03883 [Minicystis rosea]
MKVPTQLVAGASLAAIALRCASPPPPIAVAPAPPPSAAPTATATASAAVSLPPQAPIDPAADQEKLALVTSICRAAIQHHEGKVRVGCRACPPFEGDDAKPDGRVAIDPPHLFPVEELYRGSFSRPGADEVAAVFEGCEPHAANYGGTLFAEKTESGYRMITYASGLHPASCRVYRRKDGRDVLVCRWSDAHQSTAFTQVFVYDLARATADDPLKGWDALATVSDNSYSVCWGIDPEGGIMQGSVIDFRFEDRNGDHVPDIVVDVMHRWTPYSAAVNKVIQKRCAEASAERPDDVPTIDVPKLLGEPAKATLELIADGQGFKPTAKTARLFPRK